MHESQSAPRKVQIGFWLLLGALSTVLAEVVSTSASWPFFTLWGWIGVWPLYTLHILVLGCILLRIMRPVTWPALFIAGALFGMYEAYLTKVLWSPTWAPELSATAGGVYTLHTAILVLFWHPWFAFMLPLLSAECLWTRSGELLSTLPDRLKRLMTQRRSAWVVLVCASIGCGLYRGIGVESAPFPGGLGNLMPGLVNVLLLALAASLWKRTCRGQRYTLRELMPSDRQARWLIGLLILQYVLYGAFLRPEALPRTLTPHLMVWAMYGVLIWTLYRLAARQRHMSAAPSDAFWPLSARTTTLLFGTIFPVTAGLITPFRGVLLVLCMLVWLVGTGLGAALLLVAMRQAFMPVSPLPEEVTPESR